MINQASAVNNPIKEPPLNPLGYWELVRATKNADLLDTIGWRNPIAVTLHLKQSRQAEAWASNKGEKLYRQRNGPKVVRASGYVPWVPVIEKDGINYHPSQALKEAKRRINHDSYGHAYHRKKKQVPTIMALEKGSDGRIHYQGAMDCPEHLTPENFISIVKKSWERMDWANGSWAEPVRNPEAWNEYILKLKTKPNFMEAIDWENLYNPPPVLAQKINA